jgi:hypothetical protein
LVVAASASAACATVSDDSGLGGQATLDTEPVTFNKHLAPLLQQHCQTCHREGGHAPFSLITYAQTKPFRNAIKNAVVEKRMPESVPVRLDTGCSDAETFIGRRRLIQSEIDTFVKWVEQGAKEGDPADLPPPLEWEKTGEWITGEPDHIVENTPKGFSVPSGFGRDIFRRLSL